MPPVMVPFWVARNSPEMPAVKTAHDLSRANRAGNGARRLLVRPYLPVGLDRLPLDARSTAGPAGRGDLACDEPVGAQRRQGRPVPAVPRPAGDRLGSGPGADR